MPQLQTQRILGQLEDIKERVLTLESAFIEEEDASKEDIMALRKMMKERKEGRLTKFKG